MSSGNLVRPDTSWFDENPEKWLEREDFKKYQELAGVDFRDLLSEDLEIKKEAQEKIVSQTTIFNEIRNNHAGFSMPVLYYTHDSRFGEPLSQQNPELEQMSYSIDMGDSLRRRHLALSYSLIPRALEELASDGMEPLIIKNMGSGMGISTLNAIKNNSDIGLEEVLNYDIDASAISLGTKYKRYLEDREELEKDKVKFHAKSMTKNRNPKADLINMIGIICGLKNKAARTLLRQAYSSLGKNGEIIVSSSNKYMLNEDPLSSFLAQHIGDIQDPENSWGLNCREKNTIYELLEYSGFRDINVYDDANYPGREELSENIPRVDRGPSLAFFGDRGKEDSEEYFPSEEVLNERIGYNWIATARK